MHGKFAFGGEGATIPGTGFGLSFALFKLWLRPTGLGFKGYTAASNEGLLGAAIMESPIVEFVMANLGDEEPFFELHGSIVDVTIVTSPFVLDGGVATINVTKVIDVAVANPTLSFPSNECRGFSAVAGNIHFRATLIELPQNEWTPTDHMVIPG